MVSIMKFKPILSMVFLKVLPAVLGLAVLVALMAYMAGALTPGKIAPDKAAAPERPTLPSDAVVEPVHEIEQPYVEEAIGTLKAASRTQISSRVLAHIKAINVTSGSQVAEGDVLIQLDHRDLQAKRSEAEAAVVAAEAALRRAKSDYERAARLQQSRTISREEFERTREQQEVAAANLNAARQKLEQMDVMLSYTTIRAPKDGVIVDRLAEPGDMARPGEPLLVLYAPGSLRLEVPVMENLRKRISLGDKLRVHIDAYNRDVEATVEEIVPQADAASRSFLVKLALPATDDLFEGLFGRVYIPAGARRHLCLNTAAVETIGQLEFVTVVEDDGTLERRMIKTGRLGRPGRIEVLSGLKAGERVLVKSEE
jgi:RND family efflux transporter MFP subunit